MYGVDESRTREEKFGGISDLGLPPLQWIDRPFLKI